MDADSKQTEANPNATFNITLRGEKFENWGPDTIKLSEASAIERAYGKTFLQFGNDIAAGSMYAVQVLCWSLLRRTKPDLRVDDVELVMGDVVLEVIDDEDQEVTERDAGVPVPTAAAADALSPSSEASTSPPSPTGSESDPGSGTS